jgi:hypothetical protein
MKVVCQKVNINGAIFKAYHRKKIVKSHSIITVKNFRRSQNKYQNRIISGYAVT